MRLLTEEKTENTNRILTILVFTFGLIAVIGLGILLALIALLLDRGATEKIVAITIVFYLACFTAIEFVLGAQISKMINASIGKEKKSSQEIIQPPVQLFAKNTAQLGEPIQTPASVTDQTTRIFDKIPLKEN